MQTRDVWSYPDDTWAGVDLVGLSVEALDGSIGKVDKASNDVGAGYIVVDTGPWIFGRKGLLPAGVIDSYDLDDACVYVQRTQDEIKNAPEFDPDTKFDDSYRNQYGSYYGPGGAGFYEGMRDYDKLATRARGR